MVWAKKTEGRQWNHKLTNSWVPAFPINSDPTVVSAHKPILTESKSRRPSTIQMETGIAAHPLDSEVTANTHEIAPSRQNLQRVLQLYLIAHATAPFQTVIPNHISIVQSKLFLNTLPLYLGLRTPPKKNRSTWVLRPFLRMRRRRVPGRLLVPGLSPPPWAP